MRKRIIISACVALVIVLLVCILPFPQRIDKTLSGIRWQDGITMSSDVELSVRGWYFRYLLRDGKDHFKGIMTYDEREIDIYLPITDIPDMDSKCGTGMFYNSDKNRMDSFGPVYVLGSFDKVFIDSSSELPPALMSFPAETRDEAQDIANELTGGSYS